MATFAQDMRYENRLTPKQVEALNYLTGFEPGEFPGPGGVIHAKTWNSLKARGFVDSEGITAEGEDLLMAYI